jgi:hypothetical protein
VRLCDYVRFFRERWRRTPFRHSGKSFLSSHYAAALAERKSAQSTIRHFSRLIGDIAKTAIKEENF